MSDPSSLRVLVIDDDADTRINLRDILDLDNYAVESAGSVAERRRAEREIVRLNTDLQRRVTELQTLLDVLPVGIAIAQDPGCRQIHVNTAFARILRLRPGANASLSAPPEERPPYRLNRGG